MSRFKVTITMPLDGYVAGPSQSNENPLVQAPGDTHSRYARVPRAAP